jgi:hypothetical protein
MKVQGVLTKAYRNDNNIHSINVNDTWYGTYKDDYSSLEGQYVEFEATQKGKYWNAGAVKPTAPPAQAASSASTAATLTGDARQSSIVVQSCYKVAATLLGSLIQADAVTLGAKGKAFDNAAALLDELTLKIYKNCINPEPFVSAVQDDDAPGPGDDYDPMEA